MEYHITNVGQVAIVDTRIGGFLLPEAKKQRDKILRNLFSLRSMSTFEKADRPARYMPNDLFFVGINCTLCWTAKSSN